MSSISFRNRIALYYSISTAIIIFIVFLVIFLIVKIEVYNDLDNDLKKEIDDLFTEITISEKGFSVEEDEWHEKEHNTLNINPIFIQFTDISGHIFNKSPNLVESELRFDRSHGEKYFYNSTLNHSDIRQVQVPVTYKDKKVGYLIVAVPLKDADAVLQNLKDVLFVAYPLILAVLFSIARILAGRSILPVKNIINTTGKISQENLGARIPYPENKDELYVLSNTINNLLDRIENAVLREKQFTSDASHELRTPLAVIKGTLEVLIRKPRSKEEYEAKIRYCIAEMDRINLLVDQLLLLARFESQKKAIKIESVTINAIVLDSILRHTSEIRDKELQITSNIAENLYYETDGYLFSIVLENLISNAIKYSNNGGSITTSGKLAHGNIIVEIADNGMGIVPEDLEKVFSAFYRSKPEEHSGTKGNGLGLSIVKRICEILGITVDIQSSPGQGTTVKLSLTAGTEHQ